MMIRTALVACAGLVLAACQTTDTGTASSTAAAPPPAKPAPAAEKSAELDPDQRICKTESVSGSQIPKRVCMTREEWREFNRGN